MYYIRIVNGNFVIFNNYNKKIMELETPEVNKMNLKKKILEVVKTNKSPMKIRDLIYTSLSLLSGYKVKQPCKSVLDKEATDPLYQELVQFVLSNEQYIETVKSSRVLRISLNDFTISDINGIVSIIPNEKIDTTAIKEMINSLEIITPQTSLKTLLKSIFMEYFDITALFWDFNNPIVDSMFQELIYSEANKKNMKVVFKDGKILMKLEKEYLPPASYVTVEALKEQIILFIKENTNIIKTKDIIFSSLEALTGFKAIRKTTRYIPTYIGVNKVRKDILVEDPLYSELCSFIDTISEYHENKKVAIPRSQEKKENIKSFYALEREKKFVERHNYFNETYIRNLYPPRYK